MMKMTEGSCFKKIKNNRGASSVLVVLVLVVMVALGLSALTTSLSAVRLGNRSGDWTVNYYLLDKAAEKNLSVIDSSIIEAREAADNYMTAGNYRMEESAIDAELQQKIAADWTGNGSLDRMERMVFFYFLNAILMEKNIVLTSNGLDTNELVSAYSGNYLPVVGFTVSGTSDPGMNLEVELVINGTDDADRFGVLKWIEKQGK
jgi:hypothetical protein